LKSGVPGRGVCLKEREGRNSAANSRRGRRPTPDGRSLDGDVSPAIDEVNHSIC